ncbi:4-carboxymuconolactone decarboxylase [Burkholderia pseudomallei]|uniref:4-carboxymuconolactone decarboxylase n=1 Tax=Burkholderia pseudomallei TaxID=28450 RepID=UPI000530BEF0|nr:4-carboxymuconolactone decarboxylase [Burkholderia pseudomallei]KGS53271.1 putative 4-carboxymuconolactone decarboxylase domain protein [Burkholderia pseudomallei MSHR5609]KGX50737.1 putative 4-carboxymuconolactone decarboxylase domain protein [Burkholderia pseudomallei TSV44]
MGKTYPEHYHEFQLTPGKLANSPLGLGFFRMDQPALAASGGSRSQSGSRRNATIASAITCMKRGARAHPITRCSTPRALR